MDIVLENADNFCLDKIYATLAVQSWFPQSMVEHLMRDSIVRQFISLYFITILGAALFYFTMSTFSYFFIFDHANMKHPKFLKNQVWKEITCSLSGFPTITALTVPWFVAEVRGYSRLYRDSTDVPWWHSILSVIGFLIFTDTCIYWVHRWLHHPLFYTRFHKPHHKWIMPTPFASHAFHPVDAYSQSVAYHLYVFMVPMNSYVYLMLYVLVNFWTINIHDGRHFLDNYFINSASHHMIHHLEFNYNFGQYFTLWDRFGGSYKRPTEDSFKWEPKCQGNKRD